MVPCRQPPKHGRRIRRTSAGRSERGRRSPGPGTPAGSTHRLGRARGPGRRWRRRGPRSASAARFFGLADRGRRVRAAIGSGCGWHAAPGPAAGCRSLVPPPQAAHGNCASPWSSPEPSSADGARPAHDSRRSTRHSGSSQRFPRSAPLLAAAVVNTSHQTDGAVGTAFARQKCHRTRSALRFLQGHRAGRPQRLPQGVRECLVQHFPQDRGRRGDGRASGAGPPAAWRPPGR